MPNPNQVLTVRLDTAYPEIVDLRLPDPALLPSSSSWTDRQSQRWARLRVRDGFGLGLEWEAELELELGLECAREG